MDVNRSVRPLNSTGVVLEGLALDDELEPEGSAYNLLAGVGVGVGAGVGVGVTVRAGGV